MFIVVKFNILGNLVYKWHFKLHEDSLDMYQEHTDTSDDDHDIRDALEAMEAALGHIIKTNPLQQ